MNRAIEFSLEIRRRTRLIKNKQNDMNGEPTNAFSQPTGPIPYNLAPHIPPPRWFGFCNPPPAFFFPPPPLNYSWRPLQFPKLEQITENPPLPIDPAPSENPPLPKDPAPSEKPPLPKDPAPSVKPPLPKDPYPSPPLPKDSLPSPPLPKDTLPTPPLPKDTLPTPPLPKDTLPSPPLPKDTLPSPPLPKDPSRSKNITEKTAQRTNSIELEDEANQEIRKSFSSSAGQALEHEVRSKSSRPRPSWKEFEHEIRRTAIEDDEVRRASRLSSVEKSKKRRKSSQLEQEVGKKSSSPSKRPLEPEVEKKSSSSIKRQEVLRTSPLIIRKANNTRSWEVSSKSSATTPSPSPGTVKLPLIPSISTPSASPNKKVLPTPVQTLTKSSRTRLSKNSTLPALGRVTGRSKPDERDNTNQSVPLSQILDCDNRLIPMDISEESDENETENCVLESSNSVTLKLSNTTSMESQSSISLKNIHLTGRTKQTSNKTSVKTNKSRSPLNATQLEMEHSPPIVQAAKSLNNEICGTSTSLKEFCEKESRLSDAKFPLSSSISTPGSAGPNKVLPTQVETLTKRSPSTRPSQVNLSFNPKATATKTKPKKDDSHMETTPQPIRENALSVNKRAPRSEIASPTDGPLDFQNPAPYTPTSPNQPPSPYGERSPRRNKSASKRKNESSTEAMEKNKKSAKRAKNSTWTALEQVTGRIKPVERDNNTNLSELLSQILENCVPESSNSVTVTPSEKSQSSISRNNIHLTSRTKKNPNKTWDKVKKSRSQSNTTQLEMEQSTPIDNKICSTSTSLKEFRSTKKNPNKTRVKEKKSRSQSDTTQLEMEQSTPIAQAAKSLDNKMCSTSTSSKEFCKTPSPSRLIPMDKGDENETENCVPQSSTPVTLTSSYTTSEKSQSSISLNNIHLTRRTKKTPNKTSLQVKKSRSQSNTTQLEMEQSTPIAQAAKSLDNKICSTSSLKEFRSTKKNPNKTRVKVKKSRSQSDTTQLEMEQSTPIAQAAKSLDNEICSTSTSSKEFCKTPSPSRLIPMDKGDETENCVPQSSTPVTITSSYTTSEKSQSSISLNNIHLTRRTKKTPNKTSLQVKKSRSQSNTTQLEMEQSTPIAQAAKSLDNEICSTSTSSKEFCKTPTPSRLIPMDKGDENETENFVPQSSTPVTLTSSYTTSEKNQSSISLNNIDLTSRTKQNPNETSVQVKKSSSQLNTKQLEMEQSTPIAQAAKSLDNEICSTSTSSKEFCKTLSPSQLIPMDKGDENETETCVPQSSTPVTLTSSYTTSEKNQSSISLNNIDLTSRTKKNPNKTSVQVKISSSQLNTTQLEMEQSTPIAQAAKSLDNEICTPSTSLKEVRDTESPTQFDVFHSDDLASSTLDINNMEYNDLLNYAKRIEATKRKINIARLRLLVWTEETETCLINKITENITKLHNHHKIVSDILDRKTEEMFERFKINKPKTLHVTNQNVTENEDNGYESEPTTPNSVLSDDSPT